MFRLGCFLTLALLSSICLGDQALVWVLGSYANHKNAENERIRLAEVLDAPVTILATESGLYRVVLDARLMTRDGLAGHDTWLLSVTSDSAAEITSASTEDTETEAVVKTPAVIAGPEVRPGPELTTRYQVSESDEDDPPLIIEEPPAEPLYPAFNVGESVTQYCERLPDSRLCQHPGIAKAIENDKKLMKHRDEIRNACEIVTDPDRRKTCLLLNQ